MNSKEDATKQALLQQSDEKLRKKLKMELFNHVQGIISEYIDPSVPITLDTTLEELEIDDLDLTDIANTVESEFGVVINKDKEYDWVTVEDIINFLLDY